MIHFSDAPPEDPRGHGLDLLRTPTSKPMMGAITCENILYCPTHFWGGRTVPHDQDDCEPCGGGSPWRTHAYVTALDHRTRLHFLFETTAKAAKPIQDWQIEHQTLRGSLFIATRPQLRHNGRVAIRIKSIDLIEFPLPEPPNILALLSIIWNIPLGDIFDGSNTIGQDAIHVERGIAEAAAKLADRMKSPKTATAKTPLPPNAITVDAGNDVAERLRARQRKPFVSKPIPTTPETTPPETAREELSRRVAHLNGPNGRKREPSVLDAE